MNANGVMSDNFVKHVIFYVPTRAGSLTLAEMDDGSLCVLQNNEPLPDCRWGRRRMHEAVAMFREIKQSHAAAKVRSERKAG